MAEVDDWAPVGEDDWAPVGDAADTRSWWERGAVRPTTLTTGDVAKLGEGAEPIVKAFGEGVKEGFGDQPLGPGPKMAKDLESIGLVPPEGTKSFLDTGWRAPFYAFNQMGIEAVTAVTEVPFRSMNAVYRGLQRAGMEAGLDRDVVSIPDAFMGSPHPMGVPKVGEARAVPIEGLRTNIENGLLGIGRSAEAAKKEATALAEAWAKQEKNGDLNFGDGSLTTTTAESDTRGLARVTIGRDGKVSAQLIGDAPKPEDFKTAADLITTPRELPIATSSSKKFSFEYGADGPNSFKMHISNEASERIGHIRGNEDASSVSVKFSGVDKTYQREGAGLEAYEHLVQYALSKGKKFVSDVEVSEPAAKIYDKLEKKGYVIEKSPKAEFHKMEEGKGLSYYLSHDGPVFTITRRVIDEAAIENALRNLRTLWDEKGIHPAEALNAAKNDTWARNELTQPPEPETVKTAAYKIGDRVFEAPIHAIARDMAMEAFGVTREKDLIDLHPGADLKERLKANNEADGFVTTRGRFVSRMEAQEIAKKYDQLKEGKKGNRLGGLNAEDMSDEAQKIIDEHYGVPRPGGADVPHDPPYVSPAVEPPPPAGSLLASARDVVDQVVGLGRNLQYILDPMATGSPRAMVIAKDAISSVRRIRWEHARRDAQIVKEFTPEQWERMWNAMDEESVLQQQGLTSEHMGLATLEPKERLMVDIVHEESQMAWLHAVDAAVVEGEGLPMYTVRMVLNVAAGLDHVAPQALNELGRNVFTRTAQMKHRKNLLAEETEAAAKELVRAKMEKAGKSPAEIAAALEKVQIARNIRAMPLATAKLQEATIWRNMINNIEDMGKATGGDTVAYFNPGKGWFTIAGNPAFTKWAPKLIKDPDGKWRAMGDDLGNTIFEPKPIYMRDEFKGPMTSILDEPPNKLVQLASTPYEALMGLKSRSMQLILNSPLIHNAVVWSKVMEAAGGREWLGFALYGKGNRIVNSNPARANQLIQRGLNPMGPRGSIQDITSMMESPDLMRGHNVSFTGKVAAFIPGLFDAEAGAAVERGIATAGNFWHNTLLWDRVRDVHFGLADHLSDRLVAQGADRLTADRVSAHFSNIIVGSIPKEAMSAAARATANTLLFSRSFTLGNLSTFKQAIFGLPKPIVAQIARDARMMFDRDAASGAMVLPPDEAMAARQAAIQSSEEWAKSIARRKAISTIVLSAGLLYTGNALFQHGFNMAMRDETLDDQLKGYARRYQAMLEDVKSDPLELRHMLERLSPTYDNEPNKTDRIHIGFDKDGTAIYARNPTGKFGEEMVGYPTKPMAMLRAKLNPTFSAMLDIMENDKGFGHKVYDEHDKTTGGNIATAFAVAKHMVMKHLPEQQITAAGDLLRGEGDTKVNALRLVGPMFGFSASVGSPRGMAGGEAFAVKQELNARFDIAWPSIKRQIQRGDQQGAMEAMDALRIPRQMQFGLMRSAMNPGAPLRGRTLREFYESATPQQIDRFERAGSRQQ